MFFRINRFCYIPYNFLPYCSQNVFYLFLHLNRSKFKAVQQIILWYINEFYNMVIQNMPYCHENANIIYIIRLIWGDLDVFLAGLLRFILYFLMNNCASFLFDWIWKIIVEWCDIVRCRWCCFCICFIFSLQSLALQSGMTQTEVRRLLCEWFCLSLALSAVNVINDSSIHYLQLKCWLNLFFLINYIHPFLLCISWLYY